MSKVKTDKQVRVISFISRPDIKDEDKYEVSKHWKDIYLTTEKDNPMNFIPLVLREEMIANGWEDKNGYIWWDADFQPKPVKGECGNVYLNLNDSTLKESEMDKSSVGARILMDAHSMLLDEERETE